MDGSSAWMIIGLSLVVLVATFALVALGRWQRHVGDKMEAKLAERRIETASAQHAFADPQLKALIACPACGARGQFDVVGKNQCQCLACGNVWDAS